MTAANLTLLAGLAGLIGLTIDIVIRHTRPVLRVLPPPRAAIRGVRLLPCEQEERAC